MGCKRHLTWCTYTGRRFFLLTQTNKPSSSLIITCYTFDIHEAYQHTPDLALSSLYWAATSLNFIPPLIFSKASRHLDCFSHSICRTWNKKITTTANSIISVPASQSLAKNLVKSHHAHKASSLNDLPEFVKV